MSRYGTVRESVERGAAFLDEVKPDWFNIIQVNCLYMESPSLCILGQAFEKEAEKKGERIDGYIFGCDLLHKFHEEKGLPNNDAIVIPGYYGFCMTLDFRDEFKGWPDLSYEWASIIQQKRGTDERRREQPIGGSDSGTDRRD